MDHAQPVVFGFGEHRVDGHSYTVGGVLEAGVGRGLEAAAPILWRLRIGPLSKGRGDFHIGDSMEIMMAVVLSPIMRYTIPSL